MKFSHHGRRLRVSDVPELTAANAGTFEAAVCAEFPRDLGELYIDLGGARWLDCGGIGALISIRNCARNQNGNTTVHLANAGPAAWRALRLTGASELFALPDDGQAS